MDPFTLAAFSVPRFVENKFYCDAGSGPSDDLSAVANTWKNHKMFSTNTTCTPDGELKNDAWWARHGGAGWFE
eukprot:5639286-Prymnesium_polylepis.1